LITESQLAVPITGVSGLSDRERALLVGDAIDAVADRDGLTPEDAACLLGRAAADGTLHLDGDREQVDVLLDGRRLLRVDRDELRAAAAVAAG
jgi:hypothetical protein